jgi:hypothetical protein
MIEKIYRVGLWVSTLIIIIISAVQGLSGNWITLYLFWPGGPGTAPQFMRAMLDLSSYHRYAGFTIGGLSIVVLVFALLSRSSIYVRIFAVLGLVMTGLAASGGVLYVTSTFTDRWSLGQMVDAFVGLFGVYLIQLFFMNRTPNFPWSKRRV